VSAHIQCRKPRLQLLGIGYEPDLGPAIAFNHEIPQRGASLQVPRNVARDRQPHSVRNKLLDELAGYAGSQLEKIVTQPRRGYQDPVCTLPPRRAAPINSTASRSPPTGAPSGAHSITRTPLKS
jgi:hypothetical protein